MAEVAEWFARIVGDARLTPAAARVAAYVLSLGPGEHEVPNMDLSVILGHVTDKPIAAAVQLAERFGYIRQRRGGRDHSPRYEFVGEDRSEQAPAYVPMPPDRSDVAPIQTDSTEQAPSQTPAPEYVGAGSDLSAPHTCEQGEPLGSEVGSEVESTPPVVPLGIDPDAEAAIEQHADRLAGCRGSLRDYLAAVVVPERQAAYVQSLVCRMEGFPPVFVRPDGSQVPMDERPRIAAAALNDLRLRGERSAERPMKHPDGSIENLETKVSVLLQRAGDAKERAGRRNGRGSSHEAARGAAAGRTAGDGEWDHLG